MRGVRAYPSVTDIPDEVDLAVVAVPAAGVDDVVDACLAKGVHGAGRRDRPGSARRRTGRADRRERRSWSRRPARTACG